MNDPRSRPLPIFTILARACLCAPRLCSHLESWLVSDDPAERDVVSPVPGIRMMVLYACRTSPSPCCLILPHSPVSRAGAVAQIQALCHTQLLMKV